MNKDNINIRDLIIAAMKFPGDSICSFDSNGITISHPKLNGCGFIAKDGQVTQDHLTEKTQCDTPSKTG